MQLSSSPRLDSREGGHPFGRVLGKMVILLDMQREDSYSVGSAKEGWSLPWTYRTARSKCLKFDMFTRPTLPWTCLTAKFKCNGLS
jgi:hypothetical protein